MAIVSQLVQLGFNPIQAYHLGFTTNYNMVGAGNNSQANGSAITNNVVSFGTVTNGSADSAVLPTFKNCPLGWVFGMNTGAGTLKLFPAVGGSIITYSTNAKIDVPSGSKFLFFRDDGDYTANDLWIGGVFA